MSNTLTKTIINCETGESEVIPLTAEEIAIAEKAQQEAILQRQQAEAEAQAKAEAKASALAKLQTLGLTEDEAVALLG